MVKKNRKSKHCATCEILSILPVNCIHWLYVEFKLFYFSFMKELTLLLFGLYKTHEGAHIGTIWFIQDIRQHGLSLHWMWHEQILDWNKFASYMLLRLISIETLWYNWAMYWMKGMYHWWIHLSLCIITSFQLISYKMQSVE